ncbi:MAG: very short patch repair endonuclease [Bryobacteraceae bacterium]|nr:very short patch repair endonuclease [Bryobacteraceae bacterium]
MDKLTPEARSANMRRIRSRDTAPEMIVRRIVHRMGFRYRLHRGDLPGRPDIVLTRLGKIVDVRGCFWHQHPGCTDSHIPKSRRAYWEPKLSQNAARDKSNASRLRAMGWRLLVIWECETKKPDTLTKRLTRFLA